MWPADKTFWSGHPAAAHIARRYLVSSKKKKSWSKKSYQHNFFGNKSKSSSANEIHHYSSMNACCSILDSKSVHMSLIDVLNDPQEGREFGDAVIKHMGSTCCRLLKIEDKEDLFFESHTCSDLIDSKFTSLGKLDFHNGLLIAAMIRIRKNLQNIQDSSAYGVYVFSLTKEFDDLNQWRAYGDDGMGVCFTFRYVSRTGFDNCKIKYLGNNRHDTDFELSDVDYYAHPRDQLIKRLVGKCGKSIAGLKEDSSLIMEYASQISDKTSEDILRLQPFYKSSYYKNENEVRMLVDVLNLIPKKEKDYSGEVVGENEKRAGCVGYKCVDKVIKPYYRYDLREGMLAKITLGPRVIAQERQKKSIEMLLKSRGITAVVDYSKIKYGI